MTGPLLGRLAARLVWKGVALGGVGFAVLAASSVAGYEAAYPTVAGRTQLAGQIGSNLGFQAIYGRSYAIDTIGGFAAWRVGGLTVVMAALWGALSATRLLRGEEEVGRTELLLAGPTTARSWFDQAAGVLLSGQLIAAVGLWGGLAATGVPVAGASLIASGVAASGFLGVALGAAGAQCLPTRRRAAVWAASAIGAAYLLRVLADGSDSLDGLRWATPFGWVEELRPFAGSRWWPVVPVLVVTVALVLGARTVVGRRDLRGALVADHDAGPGRDTGLDGVIPLALRTTWPALRGWGLGLGAFAVVMGLLASDVAAFARRSAGYVDVARRLGISDPTSPAAFVGLSFGFLVVLLAAYVATQVASTRAEEADGRVDQLLSQPLARVRWLSIRTAITLCGAVVLAILMALSSWVGVAARGGGMSLGEALAGGMNLVPLAVLVAGIGVAAHGLVPRSTAAVAIGVVAVGYLVELVGSLLQAPTWLLDVSPFHHLAPVPAVAVRFVPLVVFLAVGVSAALVGVIAFDRRDLVSG